MNSNNSLRIFKGAVAIITGGASGIGKALSIELSKNGCEVVIADIQDNPAQELVALIRAAGGKAVTKKIDVRDLNALKQLVEETVQRTGRLDYLFNNAGVFVFGEMSRIKMEDINLMMDINFKGVVNGIQAAYPVMLKQKYGQIINTASYVGLIPEMYCAIYAATKHGIVGLSKSLREEAAVHGIRVNVLCPGIIETPLIYGSGANKNYFEIPDTELEEIFKKIKPIDAGLFARKALKQIARNKAIIVIPSFYKVRILLYNLFPGVYNYILRMAYRKFNRERALH
ncbi:MAG: SDR family oxidoreductase [Bacteroidetes bacterium]|nr:SDR family oxidoreductase [Bacteroidota bacterium]